MVRIKRRVLLAGMTNEENSFNANSAESETIACLAGVTNKEYSGNAGKNEPEKNAFVLLPG